MNGARFESDKQLLQFAKHFMHEQVDGFRKDIDICLTMDRRRRHAYFPALIRCLSFADFLGGLHAGNIDGHGLFDLQKYAKKFMDRTEYDDLRLAILYEGFRHKIAHLSDPYPVFDTATKPKRFRGLQHRITWTVYAGRRPHPIKLIRYQNPIFLKKRKTPWPVSYDHRIEISLRSFANDIVRSIYGRSGYLQHVRSDSSARKNFEKAMQTFFAQ